MDRSLTPKSRTTVAARLTLAVLSTLLLFACTEDGGGGGSPDCDADPVVLTTNDGVEFVRTPDACFANLPDWPYEPQYVEIDGLRQAYVDEGPPDGEVVLLLHGPGAPAIDRS
jgi:hypothetical protein